MGQLILDKKKAEQKGKEKEKEWKGKNVVCHNSSSRRNKNHTSSVSLFLVGPNIVHKFEFGIWTM